MIGFVEFVESIGVQMTKAQLVLVRVAFDNVEPRDLEGEERELARRIFGPVEIISPVARRVLVAVCGARSGKSYLLIALRLLHLALTVDLSSLAPGQSGFAIAVAPDKRLSREILGYVEGALQHRKLRLLRVAGDSDSVTIRRGSQEVVITALPATRGGSAVRGRSLVGCALDESAFFLSDDYVVADVDIFRAMIARVLPGGQAIVASTPWAENGLLYDLFSTNFGDPTIALAALAPTELLRNDEHTLSIVATERSRDPENASREYDCEFLTKDTSRFFDPNAIKQCTHDYTLPQDKLEKGAYFFGGDLGFVRDSSACVGVHRVDDMITVVSIDEMRPSKNAPLKPSEVISTFAGIVKRYGCDAIVSDGHYREAVREIFEAQSLQFRACPEGNGGKVEMYQLLRRLLNEGKLWIPNHPRLLQQLNNTVSRPTAGGNLSITIPRRGAYQGHGDIVSALAAALWAADTGRGFKAKHNTQPAPRSSIMEYVNGRFGW